MKLWLSGNILQAWSNFPFLLKVEIYSLHFLVLRHIQSCESSKRSCIGSFLYRLIDLLALFCNSSFLKPHKPMYSNLFGKCSTALLLMLYYDGCKCQVEVTLRNSQ